MTTLVTVIDSEPCAPPSGAWTIDGECFPTATAADWAFVVAAYGATVRAAAKVAA